MTLIDTHAHLYLPDFTTEIREVISRAKSENVEKIYLPSIDSETIAAMIDLESAFPGICESMIGLHPCSVKDNFENELDLVSEWLAKRSFAAIGEIGLDFYWDKTFRDQQYTAFETQIELALLYNLPIVIHSREAGQECLDMVRKYHDRNLKGIFHCFSGSYELACSIVDTGFYLGIGGVITYKNSGLAEVVKKIPLEHLVLETDAPYLTPVPFRGKRNESSYLTYIVAKLAEVKGTSIEEVALATTANAKRIFGS